jgi:hypothetical protein
MFDARELSAAGFVERWDTETVPAFLRPGPYRIFGMPADICVNSRLALTEPSGGTVYELRLIVAATEPSADPIVFARIESGVS